VSHQRKASKRPWINVTASNKAQAERTMHLMRSSLLTASWRDWRLGEAALKAGILHVLAAKTVTPAPRHAPVKMTANNAPPGRDASIAISYCGDHL